MSSFLDEDENYMLKIGTTNDLERRRKEHCRYYRKAKKYTMPKENEFVYKEWGKENNIFCLLAMKYSFLYRLY